MLSSTKADGRLGGIAVVVINWNDLATSIECLDSIHKASPETIRVLVDNGSEEDPRGAVEAKLPGVHLVRLETNRGYAGGCNAGANAAISLGAEYVLLLNNDTTIDTETLPGLMHHALQHPRSILAPKIVYADQPEVVWSAGGRVSGPLVRNEHVGAGDPVREHEVASRVDWATGCALFLSADSFRHIGPMDEAYFLYLEDVDWCLRAARLGIDTRFVPEAVVRHQVSRTLRAPEWADHVRYYAYRNQYRLAFRQGSIATRPIVVADAVWTLTKAGIRSAISPNHRRDSHYHVRTVAVFDFFRRRWGPYSSATPISAVKARVGAS